MPKPDMSPLGQIRQLERQMLHLNGHLDPRELEPKAQRSLHLTVDTVTLARQSLQDYQQLDDDRRAQAQVLPLAIEYLQKFRDCILVASQYNIFSAVDVAQITGQLDEIIEQLH
jgi:hypothetical protein